MPSPKVFALTREEIAAAAQRLGATRPAKWTVMVDGRELAARPLVLEAAGVPPNDPTNSHQAVAILQDRGFDVFYEGKVVGTNRENVPDVNAEDLIRSMRGCLKGDYDLVADREREHRIEKER